MRECASRYKMSNRGKLIIISGPSGAGKTTLVNRLTKEFPQVVQNVSYTTRKARPEERQGVHYNFVTEEVFQQKMANQDFLEAVSLFGVHYGTAKESVEQILKQGKYLILVIDTQGALKLKEQIEATFIFITPPSIQVLQERLERRKKDKPEDIAIRLKRAKEEIALKIYYDFEIINDDLSSAYRQLKQIVFSEEKDGNVNK